MPVYAKATHRFHFVFALVPEQERQRTRRSSQLHWCCANVRVRHEHSLDGSLEQFLDIIFGHTRIIHCLMEGREGRKNERRDK